MITTKALEILANIFKLGAVITLFSFSPFKTLWAFLKGKTDSFGQLVSYGNAEDYFIKQKICIPVAIICSLIGNIISLYLSITT